MSVYAIKSDTGRIKVGLTTGTPAARMATLQTGNPHVLTLLASLDTESAGIDHAALEASIHRRLDRFRVVGEWFLAPDWVVVRVMVISFIEMDKPALYQRWERRYGRYCRMWMTKIGAKSAVTPAQDKPAQRAQGPEKSTAGARAQPGNVGSSAVVSAPDTGREVGGSNPSSPRRNADGVAAQAEQVKRGAEPAPIAPAVDTTTRGTPRKRAPKGTFDRKAYQRQKARERRSRLKADQSKRED